MNNDPLMPILQNLTQITVIMMVLTGLYFLVKLLITRGGGTRVVYRDQPATSSGADGSKSIAKTWALACAARDEFVAEHTEYEVGEHALEQQLLKRPLLKDSSEPLTAAWLDAKEDFDAHFPSARPATVDAVERALALARSTRDAWRAADKNARTKGIGHLSDADAARLDQVQRLLTAARDRGTTVEERRNQVRAMARILKDLTHRPEAAVIEQIEKGLNPWLRSINAPELRLAIEAAPAAAATAAPVGNILNGISNQPVIRSLSFARAATKLRVGQLRNESET